MAACVPKTSMAARCSMCLCKAITYNSRRTLVSVPSRLHFGAKLSGINSPETFSFAFSRKIFQRSTLQTSQKSDGTSILGSLKAAGAIPDTPPVASEKDQKQEKEKKNEENFRKRAMKFTFIAFGTMFTGMIGLVIYECGSPDKDEYGNVIPDDFSNMPIWKAYLYRTHKELMFYNKLIKDPSREKLLPEPLTEPYYQPPYTLVLEMTGVLVHPDWTYQTGWRFKKRPGVDYFLQQVGPPLFEIVIYTSEQGFTAYPILDTLDPNGYIMYRLFRDATRYVEGHHVKDLSCLNRDLSKVIFIDWNQKSISLQPQNALLIKKWTGNDDDRALYDLASLLRTIATSDVEDVRTVLEYYSQFDDPVAVYKENQRKLQEEEKKRQEENIAKSSLASTWSQNLRARR